VTLRAFVTAACVALAAYAGATTGWLGRGEPQGPPRLTVVFTGEDLGHLEPCGCSPAMLGGLARRPARIAASKLPGVPTVYVSGGYLAERDAAYDGMRVDMMLRSLAWMGCDVWAPSPADEAALANAGSRAAVLRRPDGRDLRVAVHGEHLVVSAGDAVSVRVLGLAGDRKSRGAVESVVGVRDSSARGQPLVVAAGTDRDAARAIASAVGGPTLVLYAGGVTDPRDSDATNGNVAVAPYPAHGKYVGVAHLRGQGAAARWTVEYRPVLHEFPEDPAIVAMREAYLGELRARDFVAQLSREGRFAVNFRDYGEEFAGNAACAQCHTEAARVWAESGHSHAMEKLRATGDDADPGCVKCHVVGYGRPGGFESPAKTPHLADVGCETCHGPRGEHAAAKREARPIDRKPPAGEGSCVPCHDGEHDPDFDFETAWPRIRHGAK
jgi:hypothetical protein